VKVLLAYPNWGNRWIPYFRKELSKYDLREYTEAKLAEEFVEKTQWADVLISMWANEVTIAWSQYYPEKKIVTYLRRFELWQEEIFPYIFWDRVDAVIFVSKYVWDAFRNTLKQFSAKRPGREYLIPNGIDFTQFPLRPKKPNTKKIAFVNSLKNVKNVPLALQILKMLPEEYTLHQIGLMYDAQISGQMFSYAHNLGLHKRYIYEGRIGSSKVGEWLEDKDFILSTSINEGNPNNIVEGMARGIKPIIHNWPGAKDQFPNDLVFELAHEAVDMITNGNYVPKAYSDFVRSRYSLDNFKQIHRVIEQVFNA
jgi:glycosyltransferase involved in cell wall biosynthesis